LPRLFASVLRNKQDRHRVGRPSRAAECSIPITTYIFVFSLQRSTSCKEYSSFCKSDCAAIVQMNAYVTVRNSKFQFQFQLSLLCMRRCNHLQLPKKHYNEEVELYVIRSQTRGAEFSPCTVGVANPFGHWHHHRARR